MEIAMEPGIGRWGKEIIKVGFRSFFKKVSFIYYLSLFTPYPFHALLGPACETVLYATSNALCLTALFSLPPFRRWPGLHRLLLFNHLAKWNQASFHFQIRWDPASLRMSILYSHKISSGQWAFPYCLSLCKYSWQGHMGLIFNNLQV